MPSGVLDVRRACESEVFRPLVCVSDTDLGDERWAGAARREREEGGRGLGLGLGVAPSEGSHQGTCVPHGGCSTGEQGYTDGNRGA